MSLIKGNHAGLGGSGAPGGALASSSIYSHPINQSLRFERGDTAYLGKTFGSAASSNQIYTFSFWAKPCGDYGTVQNILSSINAGAGTGEGANNFSFYLGGQFYYGTENGGENAYTKRLFNDHSAWYHFCVQYDSTQSTATDRLKIYINGVNIPQGSDNWTSAGFGFPETPGLNSVMTSVNQNGRFNSIGAQVTNVSRYYYNGYLAEVIMLDGVTTDCTAFGEFVDGVWIPKEYSGSFGNNGYHLDFADSSAIGNDVSGNNNDWSVTDLVASDVVPDSPTNNFATFNALDVSGTGLTYSEGNLKAERTSSSFAQAYSSFSFNSGKWYAEFLLDTGNSGVGVIAGTTNPGANRYMGQDSYTYGYYSDGRKVNNGSYTSYGDSYTTAADGSGDVVGVYIDADNGNIYFSKNGTVQNSGTAAFTSVTGPFRFAIASESSCFHIANFGQDDTFAGLKTSGSAAASDSNSIGKFYDTIGLSDYLAPCTSNLPDITIGPGQDTQADDHFNTVLYTGTGSNISVSGVGFSPNWVWLKSRSSAYDNMIFDTVRGTNKILKSNGAAAEITTVSTTLLSFDSDGFTYGTEASVNTASSTNVGWNWKGGGSANTFNVDGTGYGSASDASLSGGDLTPTGASINTTAGFGIIGYTGNGSATQTIKHGLSSPPEFIIIKDRDSNSNNNQWQISSSVVGDDYAYFTSAAFTGTGLSIPTSGDATTITLGRNGTNLTNESGDDFIMYCFHSVEGYSKFGTYEGNAAADGTFVFTGFRPAWIMVKETDASGFWMIQDNKIYPINDGDTRSLAANDTATESTISGRGNEMDILSNGFKMRASTGDFNASNTHVYLAFAEQPFKFANAR